jgi:hypothetical protein
VYEQRTYVVLMPQTKAVNTPTRGIRVPDHEWEIFQEVTAANGETASAVARRLFREYVKENDPEAYARLRQAAARKRGKHA